MAQPAWRRAIGPQRVTLFGMESYDPAAVRSTSALLPRFPRRLTSDDLDDSTFHRNAERREPPTTA
ncbi:MAG: hypothetical protein U0164_06230 [Gemmatimonadaceae bacterium]